MEYIVILIIVLCISAYICYPFFIKSNSAVLFEEEKKDYTEVKKSELEMLEDNKLELYSAIKEIDFDYGMGKLSEEDYKELRKDYLYKASKILKEIKKQSVQSSQDVKDTLEEEILKARNKYKLVEDKIEIEIKKQREKAG
jgi:hypothetical protein